MIDFLHDIDLPLEVLLLRLDKVVVALLHAYVDSANVALDRRFPSVVLAHERHTILFTIEQLTVREIEQAFVGIHESCKSQGRIEIKCLARWIVAALIMSFGELGNILAIQSASRESHFFHR